MTSYIAHHFLTRRLDLGGEIASIKEELADIRRLLEEREQRLDERDGESQV